MCLLCRNVERCGAARDRFVEGGSRTEVCPTTKNAFVPFSAPRISFFSMPFS